ncbi:MAG: hypothetical protein CSA11_01470 [Chloroflexi bacterium]|nr:MAG: hypothetical protein CSA11_01470 [Chloroflexota bacterium]
MVKQVGVLASAVITNVVEPTEERCFTRQKIESGTFRAPQSGQVGLGILHVDPKIMSDPELFVSCLDVEYKMMRDLSS